MQKSRNVLDQGGRLCLVLGLVLLLVGNLIPVAGAKGAILVTGEFLALIGIAAWLIGLVVTRVSRPQRRRG